MEQIFHNTIQAETVI